MGYEQTGFFEFEADQNEMERFPLIPPGRYLVKVQGAEAGSSKTTARPQLIMDMTPIFPKAAGTVRHFLTLIPKGQPGHGLMLHALKSLGLPYNGHVKFNVQNVLGLEAVVDIVNTKYNGRDVNSIQKFVSEDNERAEFLKHRGEAEDSLPF